MNAQPFDEFDDKFEDNDTWLDDFDDRDDTFSEAAENALLDNSGIDFGSLGTPRRLDLGVILSGDDEDSEEEIAA